MSRNQHFFQMLFARHIVISRARTCTSAISIVGDGIYDAPALTRDEIGFAMGAAGTATMHSERVH